MDKMLLSILPISMSFNFLLCFTVIVTCLFFDTEVAAGFAVEIFPTSLIVSVVCLIGSVAEDELFQDLDGMWHDEACSDGVTIKHLALDADLT